MKNYLLKPKTLIAAWVMALIVTGLWYPDSIWIVIAAGLIPAVVELLVSYLRLRRSERDAHLSLSVTRQNGKRETVTLDPEDDASIDRFVQAIEEDNARNIPPEVRGVLKRQVAADRAPLPGV